MMPIPDGVALSWKVDCFWGEPISYGGKTFARWATPTAENFMDIEASYWPARFKLAPGEKLVLAGYYPHARYASVNSYGGGAPTSSLVDADIEPDAGSTNPFRQGARRDTPNDQRRYTFTVVNEPEPANKADRAPNTLYARPAASPTTSSSFATAPISSTKPRRTPSTSAAAFPCRRRSSCRSPTAQNVRARRSARATGDGAKDVLPRRRAGHGVVLVAGPPCTDATPGAFCNDPLRSGAEPAGHGKILRYPVLAQGAVPAARERAKLKPPSSCKLAKGSRATPTTPT